MLEILMIKLIGLILLLSSCISFAQPTQVIVPYPPGNGGDIIFRIFEAYCESKNIQVYPSYKIGADGVVGLVALSNMEKNGKTIAMTGTVSLSKTLEQNSEIKFDYISLASVPTFILISSKSSGITTLQDLERKIDSGQRIIFASGGASHLNLIDQLLKNLKLNENSSQTIVPYKNTNQLIVDLIGGRVEVGFVLANLALKYEADGKLNILASTDKINKFQTVLLTDKYKNWVNINAYGLIMPDNSSPDVVKFWATTMQGFLNDTIVRQQIENDHGKIPKFGSTYFKTLVDQGRKTIIPK